MPINSDLIDKFTSLVTPTNLWLVLIAVGLYVLVMSIIFIYHWRKFGTDNLSIRFAETVYLLVTPGLLVLLILVTVWLTNAL